MLTFYKDTLFPQAVHSSENLDHDDLTREERECSTFPLQSLGIDLWMQKFCDVKKLRSQHIKIKNLLRPN